MWGGKRAQFDPGRMRKVIVRRRIGLHGSRRVIHVRWVEGEGGQRRVDQELSRGHESGEEVKPGSGSGSRSSAKTIQGEDVRKGNNARWVSEIRQ